MTRNEAVSFRTHSGHDKVFGARRQQSCTLRARRHLLDSKLIRTQDEFGGLDNLLQAAPVRKAKTPSRIQTGLDTALISASETLEGEPADGEKENYSTLMAFIQSN